MNTNKLRHLPRGEPKPQDEILKILKRKSKKRWYKRFITVRVCDDDFFNFFVSYLWVIVLATFVAENISPSAYGRFGSEQNRFSVPPRIGWWLMELPVSFMFLYFFFIKPASNEKERFSNLNAVQKLMAVVFIGHYAYRGWYFPSQIVVSENAKNFSLFIALGGWLVTLSHGYLNAKWFRCHGRHLNNKWLKDSRFKVGLFMYYSGFAALVYHDNIMRNLRLTPGPRYKIPYGGLFEYATCAHYFVELYTWLGFAILSWGPNGLFIFLVSCMNLIPRAVSTHEWYIEKFGDEYPVERAYLVPFLW